MPEKQGAFPAALCGALTTLTESYGTICSICCALILLQDRQQQMAGICLFAAQVPGKLHCTAQQSVRLMRKALVTAKAHFFPDAHLPAPC